jgi:hypothetical protein
VQDFPGMTQAAAAAHPEAVAEHLGHDWFLNAEYGSWEKKPKSWIKRIVSDEVSGWANLSGLAADPDDSDILYAVTDKGAPPARILTIDVSKSVREIVDAVELAENCGANLDLEGIAAKKDGTGGFWIVSEGGKENDQNNQLLEVRKLDKLDKTAECTSKIALPTPIRTKIGDRGLEGVTVDEDGKVYVAVQSALDDEERAPIAKYDPETGAWSDDDYYYALDKPAAGAKVGINELLYLGGKRFAVIERDNKERCEAKIKRIHTFTLPPEDGSDQLVKEEGIDLIKFFNRHSLPVSEQIEGLAITPDGGVFVVTDDKAEDTRLLYLGDAEDKDLKLTPEPEPEPKSEPKSEPKTP